MTTNSHRNRQGQNGNNAATQPKSTTTERSTTPLCNPVFFLPIIASYDQETQEESTATISDDPHTHNAQMHVQMNDAKIARKSYQCTTTRSYRRRIKITTLNRMLDILTKHNWYFFSPTHQKELIIFFTHPPPWFCTSMCFYPMHIPNRMVKKNHQSHMRLPMHISLYTRRIALQQPACQ